MAISVKDLRYRTRQVLQSLKRGAKPIVTYRGRPVARIVPLTTAEKKSFHDIGYGMWKDHEAMKDTNRWLDAVRSPRFHG